MLVEPASFGQNQPKHIAIIGTGIAGLSAAWLLSQNHRVTVYEAADRLGGHSNTVIAPTPGGPTPVDTGFIVYNEDNYPNLVALFKHLGVQTQPSEMTFSASLDGGRLEYCGTNLNGLIGQRGNVIRPRFWRMVADIVRFYRDARTLSERAHVQNMTLGEYVDANKYTDAFIEDHLLPLGAAIWSTTAREMRDYPLVAFVRFFNSHGLFNFIDRPKWRTVTGGSRQYVDKISENFRGAVRLNAGVVKVVREHGLVHITDVSGHTDVFTDVVIAAHADQALTMLDAPSADEQRLLGNIGYTDNSAVLHSDTTIMPRRRRVWSSWNYIGETGTGNERPLCVTYWMNRLQQLDYAHPLFVTLNPTRTIAPEKIIKTQHYTHPLFDQGAIEAQKQLWQLQGKRNTWFCGSYFGHGFHEDGLQSGLAAAEACGGQRRPWEVEAESSRITLAPMLEAAE